MNTPEDTPNRPTGKTPRPLSHIPTPTIGPRPTAAEIDASMLEDLRQWRGRQDPTNLGLNGARLTSEEFDMLLRVAAERDDLLAERKAERIGEAVADAFDPYGPPLDFSGHTPAEGAPGYYPHEGPVGTWRETPCTHAGHAVTTGGAVVCGACGLLLAWIRS